MKCEYCNYKIKKISNFKSLFFQQNLICQKCKNIYKPSKIFKFFVQILSGLNIVLIFIFAYYIQDIFFKNTEQMRLFSFIFGIFLYLIILIILTILTPYKKIKEK